MSSVSILMPAYNAGRFVTAAVESVLAQSYRDWTLVIVDDGSTDDTGDVVDRLARGDARIRVLHQANGGIADARNRALESSDRSSEFIAFLDSDDVWFPGTLMKLVSALRASPGSVGTHGMLAYIDAEGKPTTVQGVGVAPLRRQSVHRGRLRVVGEGDATTFHVLAYGNCAPTGAVLVRHAAVRTAGRFDPKAVPADDWDMWLRLAAHGPFHYLPEPLYGYRLHGANTTRNSERKNGSFYYVRHKLANDPTMPSALRSAMVTGYRWYELYRAVSTSRGLFQRVRRGRMSGFAATSAASFRYAWRFATAGRRLESLATEFLSEYPPRTVYAVATAPHHGNTGGDRR